MGKGSGSSKDQLKRENRLTDQALAEQKALRLKISAATDKFISGAGEGFAPSELAAMRSSFLNSNDTSFNSAGQGVRSFLASRGELSGPVSGGAVRDIGSLEGMRAGAQSSGLLGIEVANAKQALANRFNALNVQSGQAAQVGQNIGEFNTGASNALSNYVRAENTGFGASFSNAFGGALGSGLGKAAMGGFGAAV